MQLTAEGLRFRLQSDLTGTRINLPYPVGKDVDAVAPLQVVLQPGDGLRMQFRYNELVERSEEHTSELQSRENLVCRLLLEKKKKKTKENNDIHIHHIHK